ncbi:unnamed protein product [Arabis nemorensis]|uniref:Uncharacterized protein n=1 Tax=Arabis nemorensis TaxID=586526 RepID=A0A565BMR1_9BRAS|nr:unnamed protein product [Arabis nemorensis]
MAKYENRIVEPMSRRRGTNVATSRSRCHDVAGPMVRHRGTDVTTYAYRDLRRRGRSHTATEGTADDRVP